MAIMSNSSQKLTAGTVAPKNPEPAPAEQKRILLVEGDGFTRLVLLLRLRFAGFHVDFTSNGVLGLGKLRTCNPDVLLVEQKLCGISGLDLIKAARAEAAFGDRPIYVYTHVNKLSRGTRKEVDYLATKLFDKNTCTREDLVQIFASTFLKPQAPAKPCAATAEPETPAVPPSEVVPTGAIEELIAGVHEQSDHLIKESGNKAASGRELLSRVSSLGSCAKAAGLANLTRQTKALESFLTQLCKTPQPYTRAALNAVARSVQVMQGMSVQVTAKKQSASTFSAVYIDEAPYSNRAAEHALLDAGFHPACFEDPTQAKEYLVVNRTDLIIANVVLPEAHGLALGDIRQLPLHVHTRVLYGPDTTNTEPIQGDLPTSAPRLDKAPALLTELVVRALNAVQCFEPEPDAVAAKAPKTLQAAARSETKQVSVAALEVDDDFNLFAAPPKRETVVAAEAPSQPVAAPVQVANKAQSFDHLFAAANIPLEPIMRAKPVVPAEDQQAEAFEQLPENQIDGTQIEEQALETLTPSNLQVEEPQAPEPEVTVEGNAAAAAWLAATAGEGDQFVAATNIGSELENEAAVAGQPAAATPNDGEDMNNRLVGATGYLAQPAENGQAGEVANQNQREDLAARVCAAEMALYHAQAQLEQREKDVAALEKQLSDAKTGPDQNGSASSPGSDARCAELEQEVAALRQAFEGLNGLGEPQNGSAEAEQKVQELEQRLNEKTTEFERAKTDQLKAQTDLQQQLEMANSAKLESETAWQQATERSEKLEQEVESLLKARADSEKAQQQAAAVAAAATAAAAAAAAQKAAQVKPSSPDSLAGASASELEQQVRQGVAALAKATAELAKERGERQRSQQRVTELNNRLQALHEDLSRSLKAQRDDLARLSTLEEEHRQATQALERSTADLEQQHAEHHLAQEQLQKTREANAQLRKDLAFFDDANKRFDGSRQSLQSKLESSLNATRESEARLQQETAERQRLAASLEEARRDLQNERRKRESLEHEVLSHQNILKEREAKLAEESSERQRLSNALDSAQRGAQDGTERDLEFSKVQSALQVEQVERMRQESQLARARQRALEAALAARALRTNLRRQIREPVENLVQSASTLLEMEMGDAQKQLAEAVLQDVLLVQTRLRDPGVAHGDSSDSNTHPNS